MCIAVLQSGGHDQQSVKGQKKARERRTIVKRLRTLYSTGISCWCWLLWSKLPRLTELGDSLCSCSTTLIAVRQISCSLAAQSSPASISVDLTLSNRFTRSRSSFRGYSGLNSRPWFFDIRPWMRQIFQKRLQQALSSDLWKYVRCSLSNLLA